MQLRFLAAAIVAALAAPGALAQDAKAWLESHKLESVDIKAFNEYEAVVAKAKGAADATAAEERVAVLVKGKPVWQSNPKETDPGSKWTIHALGRDLDGDGKPDLHVSSHSGGPSCCTTHHVYRLAARPVRLAVYNAGNVAAGEFVEVPGRKVPVMISADDSSANAFAPYANSYFPVVILEVGRNRLQFARDLMQTRLPGQPPPVCATPLAASNPWLRERCGEYQATRRNARTKEVQGRLAQIKSGRSADKLKWEDYFETGVLAAVSAEMNRYAYTGHGHAGYTWLEQIWPGNDAIKVKFVQTLRQTQAKSSFAEDLKTIAADQRTP